MKRIAAAIVFALVAIAFDTSCVSDSNVAAQLETERAYCVQRYEHAVETASSREEAERRLSEEIDACHARLQSICERGGGSDCQ